MRARDNPFRADRVEALRYRQPGFAWRALLARLWAQGGGAIRGAQGSGKTTLLHELGDRLEDAGYGVRRLRPDLDDRCLAARQVLEFGAAAGGRTVLLLDGADRVAMLRRWHLMRAARDAAALVVTTHREGGLPTLHRCVPSAGLLRELIGELDSSVAASRADELFVKADGNVRMAMRELYDAAAGRVPRIDAG